MDGGLWMVFTGCLHICHVILDWSCLDDVSYKRGITSIVSETD